MSLLHQLYEEERELQRLIGAARESNESEFRIEDYEIRLGRVQHTIASIEQPFDVGGWEDH